MIKPADIAWENVTAEQHAGCQHNWARQKRASRMQAYEEESITHAYELRASLCDRKGVTYLFRGIGRSFERGRLTSGRAVTEKFIRATIRIFIYTKL